MAAMQTIGLILAGGASRRFGGRDKAWQRCAGRPLACHAIARLAPQVDVIVASANRHRWAWRRLGVDTVVDDPAWRGRGPLAAIASTFGWLAADPRRAPDTFDAAGATVTGAELTMRLATVPVDAPRAPPDFVARLSLALDRGASAAALVGAGRRQPLFALLSSAVAPAARAALREPQPPSMQAWLDDVGAAWIEGPWPAGAFSNVNTPAELAAVEAELQT
jgi:molybdopterin-guanine dinucleotide biosynthesis protein A